MNKSIVLDLPFLPDKSLSPNGRAHWRERKRHADSMSDSVIARVREHDRATIDPCKVVYHVRWCGKASDRDNFIASMKPALDALVHTGIIVDDAPGHLHGIEVTYERVKHRNETGVRIEIGEV